MNRVNEWLDSLTLWLGNNPEWLALAIVLIACIECLAIVGILIPGTILMFAVAVLAGDVRICTTNTIKAESAHDWARSFED